MIILKNRHTKTASLYFEQGIYFSINFVLITYLSLTFEPKLFKEWAIINMVIYMASGAISLFVGQPYTTQCHKYSGKYLLFNLYTAISLSLIWALLIVIVFSVWKNNFSPQLFLAVTLGVISLSTYELWRKRLILNDKYLKNALNTSTIFLLILFSIQAKLSVLSTIICTHLIFIIILLSNIMIDFYRENMEINEAETFQTKKQIQFHKDFGVPLFLGYLIFWIYSSGFLIFVSNSMSTKDFNMLRIIINLLFFGNLVLMVFENTRMNQFSRWFETSDIKKIYIESKAFLIKYSLFYTFGLSIVLTAFLWIYEHSFQYLNQFLITSLSIFIYGIAKPFTMKVKAANKNKLILISHVLTLLILIGCYNIIYVYHLASTINAFCISMLLSYSIFTISQYYLSKRVFHEKNTIY